MGVGWDGSMGMGVGWEHGNGTREAWEWGGRMGMGWEHGNDGGAGSMGDVASFPDLCPHCIS